MREVPGVSQSEVMQSLRGCALIQQMVHIEWNIFCLKPVHVWLAMQLLPAHVECMQHRIFMDNTALQLTNMCRIQLPLISQRVYVTGVSGSVLCLALESWRKQ
jgi:hypothetical protein